MNEDADVAKYDTIYILSFLFHFLLRNPLYENQKYSSHFKSNRVYGRLPHFHFQPFSGKPANPGFPGNDSSVLELPIPLVGPGPLNRLTGPLNKV